MFRVGCEAGSERQGERTEQSVSMKTGIFTLLVIVASLDCWANPPLGEASVVIGQPSIFWHNGQWQTYHDGVWTPYGTPVTNRFARPRANEGSAYSGSGMLDFGTDRKPGLCKSSNFKGDAN